MDPYADSVDHLLAELRRLDLLLSDRVETWHSESGTIAEFRGLCVSDEQVAHLLDPTSARNGHRRPDADGAGERRLGRVTQRIRVRTRLSTRAGRELQLMELAQLRRFVAELEAVLGGNAKHRRSMQLETRRIAREEGLSLP